MIFSKKLFQKWALAQLLQFVFIPNIYANTNNDMPPWLVAINTKNSREWSYGSLISDRAVLTSAAVVTNAHESDLTVMRECEILSLLISPVELCDKRRVLKMHVLGDLNANAKFQNYLVILILESPFDPQKIINIAEGLDDIDENNCLFMQWDFIDTQDSMVKSAIINSYKVFFLENEWNITKLIHYRIKNQGIEYAISNVTAMFLEDQDGYKVTIDTSKEFLGNPLICTLKSNPSTYVQIGVAAGYVTLRSNDFQLILGRYYINVVEQHSKITTLAETDNSSFVKSMLNMSFLKFLRNYTKSKDYRRI